jgi:hypothetical protein
MFRYGLYAFILLPLALSSVIPRPLFGLFESDEDDTDRHSEKNQPRSFLQ